MKSHVYLIGAYLPGSKKPRMVKIGRAKDVERRLKTLQTSQALELRLIAKWPASAAQAHHVESRAHARFAPARIRGEWFQPHVHAIVDYVNSVLTAPCPGAADEIEAQRVADLDLLSVARKFA